jgi:biopolymer transport protein ExbB
MNASSTGFLSFITQTDAIGTSVLILLALMSVGSWLLILRKGLELLTTRRQSTRAWRLLQAGLHRADPGNALRNGDLGNMLNAGLDSLRQWQQALRQGGPAMVVGDPIERAMGQAMADGILRHEQGLTFLACVAAGAPFVGLFGTVLGIYHALTGIGATGEAGLAQVAGPVGEALLMTACGLACAIPAVLAYNFFVRSNRIHLAEMERFAHQVHTSLTLTVD